jgi:hypothetical protein
MSIRLHHASVKALKIISDAGPGGITTYDLHMKLAGEVLPMDFERQRGFLVTAGWVIVIPPNEDGEKSQRDEAFWRDQHEILRAGPQLIASGVPEEGVEVEPPEDGQQFLLPVPRTAAPRPPGDTLPLTLTGAFRRLPSERLAELREALEGDRHRE